MYLAGTLSFQASQPIMYSKNVSVSIDAMKHFWSKLGEKYSLQKKPETQHDSPPSSEGFAKETV